MIPKSSKASSPKKSVLIVGASGAVGSAVVRLGSEVAQVEGVCFCGAKNAYYLESLGAVKTLDYATDSVETLQALGRTFEFVLDCVVWEATSSITNCFDFLNPDAGFYVTCSVGPVQHGGSKPITYSTLLNSVTARDPRFLGNYLTGAVHTKCTCPFHLPMESSREWPTPCKSVGSTHALTPSRPRNSERLTPKSSLDTRTDK
jgi:hypothetical protein